MFRAAVTAFLAAHGAAECAPGSGACKADNADQEVASMKVQMLQKRGGAARVHTEEEIESLEARRAAILAELDDLDVELAATGYEDEAELAASDNTDKAPDPSCVDNEAPFANWNAKTCAQQKAQGKCGEVWNKYPGPQGFCRATCGYCQGPSPAPNWQPGGGGNEAMQSGAQLHLKNNGGKYLDTCGGSSCQGGYAVSMATSGTRDHLSGTWAIEKAFGGGQVNYNDNVYIKNLLSPKGTYLDVCGASSCSSGGYGVRAGSETHRDGLSGTWKIEGANGNTHGPVKYGDQIRIKSAMFQTHSLVVCQSKSPVGGCGNNLAVTDQGALGTTWEITKGR